MATSISFQRIVNIKVKEVNFSSDSTSTGQAFTNQRWVITNDSGETLELNFFAKSARELSINFEGTENV